MNGEVNFTRQTEPGLVLVVDDVDIYRSLARIHLESIGWTVDECESGAHALAYLGQKMPQAMLIDISMPGMSGDELARRIRAEVSTAVRLVAHTSHCMDEELRRFKAAGFDHVLIKPVSPEDMAAALPLERAKGIEPSS